MVTGDLFEALEPQGATAAEHRTPLQADLSYFRRFFAPAEADAIFARLTDPAFIRWRQDQLRMYGRRVAVPRLTAWYGDTDKNYSYSGIAMNPQPWNALLQEIRARVEPAAGVTFTSVLLNLYRDGHDSVSWHSDDEPELGREPTIASVSLGAEREFRLRHKNFRNNGVPMERFLLASGSLLIMRGPTQHFWQHCVPKRIGKASPGARINLTFRRIQSR